MVFEFLVCILREIWIKKFRSIFGSKRSKYFYLAIKNSSKHDFESFSVLFVNFYYDFVMGEKMHDLIRKCGLPAMFVFFRKSLKIKYFSINV